MVRVSCPNFKVEIQNLAMGTPLTSPLWPSFVSAKEPPPFRNTLEQSSASSISFSSAFVGVFALVVDVVVGVVVVVVNVVVVVVDVVLAAVVVVVVVEVGVVV